MMPYWISANFNGIKLTEAKATTKKCPVCRLAIDKWNEVVDSKDKPGVDFSISYDGFTMVSKKFKRACEESGIYGIDFRPLTSGYFLAMPMRSVELDLAFSNARFLEKCSCCGQFFGILVHPKRRLLEREKLDPLEIVKSSVELGDSRVKGFDFIIGDGAYECLNSAKLRGCRFHQMSP